MSYWHGGLPIRGDRLLPGSEHGQARVCGDEPWVYLTTHRHLALMYACSAENGWLYEVEPLGELEQDPDSLLDRGVSLRCPEARILRRYKPSNRERDIVRGVLARLDRTLA